MNEDDRHIDQLLAAIVYHSSVDGRERHLPPHVQAAIAPVMKAFAARLRREGKESTRLRQALAQVAHMKTIKGARVIAAEALDEVEETP